VQGDEEESLKDRMDRLRLADHDLTLDELGVIALDRGGVVLLDGHAGCRAHLPHPR